MLIVAELCKGTYFSLPEWYNPAYAKYAMPSFPGGPPVNPYTGNEIPYTGYVDVDDFVLDIQVPQMNTLFYDYDTEVMWCDIGGANNSTEIMPAWLNWAQDQGRQVVYNDRCGISSNDFNTPEFVFRFRLQDSYIRFSFPSLDDLCLILGAIKRVY